VQDPFDRHEAPIDPRERFTDRAERYARYRPGYPEEIVGLLREEIGLQPDWVVADVGSGTGISADPFLAQGHPVFAVEPNAAMRRLAEERHRDQTGFHSVDGSAEATGLPSQSVDLVVAAQAFHWFDQAAARREFRRILREPGWVAVFWNVRRTDASALMRGYEALIREFRTTPGTPWQDLERFLGRPPRKATLANEQIVDFDGLEGLVLSASYVPLEGDARHGPMLDALRDLFDRHQEQGRVRLVYQTELYYGRLEG
jgi:SAM-dependent methyltransferase